MGGDIKNMETKSIVINCDQSYLKNSILIYMGGGDQRACPARWYLRWGPNDGEVEAVFWGVGTARAEVQSSEGLTVLQAQRGRCGPGSESWASLLWGQQRAAWGLGGAGPCRSLDFT